MIIFYNKNTGDIVGTIDGRVHGEDHLKMWVGDPQETDRIVCNWKKDKDGKFSPEIPDFEELERPNRLNNFKIDIKNKALSRLVDK